MKIAFTAASTPQAKEALALLTQAYGQVAVAQADVVVSLGGDGHVLRTLYDVMEQPKPIFAMRRMESVGFLCNDYRQEGLPERLAKAQTVRLRPLRFTAKTTDGREHSGLAINEVTIVRETPQTAHLRLCVDGIERIARFSGDGILVATPAGSTAYNHSCGGPIMPLDSSTLVVTAICGFRPRRWSYAVLPQNAVVDIEALETAKRPVRIEAGPVIIPNVASAHIALAPELSLSLLFDPDQHLGERIVREQFMLID
ncbi:MAG: NAD kinase [Bdellovibrionales bacterium]